MTITVTVFEALAVGALIAVAALGVAFVLVRSISMAAFKTQAEAARRQATLGLAGKTLRTPATALQIERLTQEVAKLGARISDIHDHVEWLATDRMVEVTADIALTPGHDTPQFPVKVPFDLTPAVPCGTRN